MIKDRDGNEWVLVPASLTTDMACGAMSVRANGSKDFGQMYAAAIAAAPQFVPAEVDDAMCERVGEIFAAKRHGNTYHERGHAMIAAVRSELGPNLGLVELREPSDDEFRDIWRQAKENEGDGSKVCSGRAMFNVVAKWLKGEL